VAGYRGQAARISRDDLSFVSFPGERLDRDRGTIACFVRLREPSAQRGNRTLLNIGGAQGTTVAVRENRLFWVILSPPLDWQAEEWHHLALTWQLNAGDPEMPFRYDAAIYLDGRCAARRTVPARPISAGTITLGCYPVPAYGRPQLFELAGDLDEFALHDRALSPGDVALAAGLGEPPATALPEPEQITIPRPYAGRRRMVSWGAGEGVRLGPGATTVIALAAEAPERERLAADELARYAERMTGERPTVVAPAEVTEDAPVVAVGRASAATLGLALPEDLGRDELYIEAVGHRAVLAGGDPDGVLNAVYETLERNGVRFYGPGEPGELVPARPALVIEHGRVRDRPWCDVRFLQPAAPSPARDEDNEWLRRNRLFVGRYSAAHRMVAPHLAEILPEGLFAEHPEYFGMDVHGVRNPPARNSLNPCTSNPDVARALAQRAIELLRETPDADYYGIEPIDGGGWCQCPDCRALDVVPENYTDRVCVLANQIAEAVEQAFPAQGKGVRFFAYQGYMYPPARTPLRADVQVQVTRGFPEMLAAWAEHCSNLQRWDYNGWRTFKWGPMPLSSLVYKARLQQQYGYRGWTDEQVSSLLRLGQPFPYIEAKLTWDPGRDVNELLDDFFPGYYGAAAAPMRRCFDLIEERTVTGQTSADNFTEHQNGIRLKPVNYGPAVWRQCLEWVAQAERLAADDPWALRHVRVARMTYLFADVARDAELAAQFVDEPDHAFHGYLAGRADANTAKLLEAVELSLQLGLTEVRGNSEPATPEAMLAMWGPLLGIDITPFRPLFAGPRIPAAEATADWELVFADDFERAELGEAWRVTDGDFRIENGHIAGRGAGLFIARPFPGDVRVEYEAWVTPQQTPCDLDAILCAPQLRPWRLGDGYLFQFGGWGNTVNCLFKGNTRLHTARVPAIVPGTRHQVSCERSGPWLRWSIDGAPVVEYQDPFEPLAGEYVGFYIDTAGQIDNVRVFGR